MRVLHLTTHLNIGGITTYIERLIIPFKSIRIETFVFSSGGERSDAMNQKGAVTFELPIRTKNELHPKLWKALPALLRIIRENKIDILHAHTRITQVLAVIAGKCAGIPVATTCHGFYKKRLGRRLFPAWGDCAIGISQSVSDQLARDFHVPDDKVKTIYNAVDLDDLDAAYRRHDPDQVRSEYGFRPQDQVVGIVARLVEDKGHEYLIRAVPLLQKEFPNIKILVVGDGRYRLHLEQQVTEMDLKSQIIFCGNVGDITKPLSAINVFALPATWREGFGLSIVEAMACYKPTIVTNIWSLNMLIQDGVTGLMVEPKKIEPLAEAIASLLRDPEKTCAMTQRARKMVEELFSISRMAQEIHEVYKSLVLPSNPALENLDRS